MTLLIMGYEECPSFKNICEIFVLNQSNNGGRNFFKHAAFIFNCFAYDHPCELIHLK